MKTLQEALRDFTRLDDDLPPEEDLPTETGELPADDTAFDDDVSVDADVPDELMNDPDAQNVDLDADEVPADPSPSDVDGSDAPWSTPSSGGGEGEQESDDVDGAGDDQDGAQEDDKELDAVADTATEDKDRQGLIRNVKGAHLIYKRQGEDGTYEELWIYNISTLQDEMTIRRAILSGTDIPINRQTSPDGEQEYKMWAAGNAEMLLITGLPN